ncbi:MAG: PKD domain-containing protein [Candidatus Bathyarchaeia archaeon]
METKREKFAIFLILVLLSSVCVLLFPTAPSVYAVEAVSLNPNHGAVGTRVDVTAHIDRPGGRYYILFATGSNGAGLGIIKSGVAPAASTLVNDYFIVPACFGSITGYEHRVQVQDESVYARNVNFYVESSISMSVSALARVEDRVPINITISGGYPTTSYSFNVRLVDDLTGRILVTLSNQQNSDSSGSLSYTLYYPDSFMSASQVGNYTIRAGITSSSPFVEDPGTNKTLTRSLQILQSSNKPPIAQILSIVPNQVKVGEQVTFVGSGNDSDGSIVGYNWTSSIDKFLSGSRSFSTSTLSEGNHVIYLRVQDNSGSWSSPVSTNLVIGHANQIPNSIIESILPNPAKLGQQVTFVGSGNDSDGFILDYRWTSSIDGWLSDSSSFSTSSLSVGDHVISFEVQDNNGSWSAPSSSFVKVELERSPPYAVIDSVIPSSIPVGEPLVITGHGNDSNGVIIGYRWMSSIDGLLSTSPEFSASGLSKGSHRITFQVQNDESVWSEEIAMELNVEEPISLFWLLPIVGGFAGVTGALSFMHFSRPPSSTKIKKDLHEKEEKEKKKRKKEKQKSFLTLDTDFPSMITRAMSYEATLKVRNFGVNEVKNIVVSVDATDGLLLEEKSKPMFSIRPNGEVPLVFRFKTSEKLKKGVYTMRFVVRSRDTPKQTRNCYSRAVKIGLLSNAEKQEYVEPLRRWLREKSYVCDELQNADNLVKSLLKYDLMILAPEIELPGLWMRNLFSFVESSQSLLVTDKVITSEEKLLADILGYDEMQYQELKSQSRLLVVSPDQLIIQPELAGGEEIHVGKLWGNVCVSKLSTGKDLTVISGENEENATKIPALVINRFMEGKTAHLNFHAEGSLSEISFVLKKTLDWLLSNDVNTQLKPWSPGLRSLKFARPTFLDLFSRSSSHQHQPK